MFARDDDRLTWCPSTIDSPLFFLLAFSLSLSRSLSFSLSLVLSLYLSLSLSVCVCVCASRWRRALPPSCGLLLLVFFKGCLSSAPKNTTFERPKNERRDETKARGSIRRGHTRRRTRKMQAYALSRRKKGIIEKGRYG
jgi:hypothetical protein